MGLIHVGAWNGREYLTEVRHRPRPLLLIEPQADAFKLLERDFSGFELVSLVNAACGSEEGEVEMYRSSPSHSSSVLPPKDHLALFPAISFDERERVALTTLDRIMSDREPLYHELVIDVQGYELEVLKGAKATLEAIQSVRCEVSTVELYEGGARIEDVDDYLSRIGFRRFETDLMYGGVHGDAVYWR